MRILVTGGAGFIGSHIAESALDQGHEVAILDDLSSGKRKNIPTGAHFYEIDVRDAEATRRAFEDFRPTAVSHQAAQASVVVSMREPALDAAINILGGLHVLDAACSSGVERFVFASTGGAIYGEVATGAATEGSPCFPISPYAIHKHTFEQLLDVYSREGKIQSTTLRYANVFGPRQDPHGEAGVVAIFFRKAFSKIPLQVFAQSQSGDAGCIRDYVFVSDVVRANLRALTGQLQHRLMNIGTGVPTSTQALAESIVRHTSSSSPIQFGPPRVGDLERSVLDPSRFQAEFGDPVTLEEGLRQSAVWFRAVEASTR